MTIEASDETIFLAADPERLYRVKRLGAAGRARPQAHRDLALLFMAADSRASAFSYEREEQAILEATRRLELNLVVEESGCLEFLEPCLVQERPEALHPVLLRHHPRRRRRCSRWRRRRAGVPWRRWPNCVRRWARKGARRRWCSSPPAASPSTSAFTQALIRAGIDNAVGWDGSVYDADAIRFAEVFYEQLAARRSVAYARPGPRHTLLWAHLQTRRRGRHWHLARVYFGPAGGGPLCAACRPKRAFRREAGFSRSFSTRRTRGCRWPRRRSSRQAERILPAFRERERAGVLIHGMGSLGKSSLAARIANRLPRHDTVVLYERYHALAVFEALCGRCRWLDMRPGIGSLRRLK